MGKAQLTVKETTEMFVYVSNKIMESKDVLTQADKAIGDGDHGVAMTRAMDAVDTALNDGTAETPQALLQAVAWAVMSIDAGSTTAR